MTTAPAAAVTPTAPTPLQARYDPLSGDERRSNPQWIRRNTGAWAVQNNGDGTPGQGQEIDPRYRERSYSFRDILESLNPIQHLPIVGQLYREATGTQLHPIARILGGAATGPLGVASAFANVALQNATGRDLGGHILHVIAPGEGDTARAQQLAGGSWIYDPQRLDASTPGQADPTANMAAAPSAPVPDVQATQRASRRRSPQVAPPPAVAQLQTVQLIDRTAQAAPGSLVPPEAVAPAGGRAPAQSSVAQVQALNAPGAAAAQGQAGRNIQQYFALAGTRPPSADAGRPIPANIPMGTGLSRRLAPALGQSPGQPANAPAQIGPAQIGPAGADAGGNDRTWFTAAMLHGVDRYRDARRTQDSEAPTVDVSE